MITPLLTIEIGSEKDVVLIRQRARQIAATLGFNTIEQTAFATATSEVARNASQYVGSGRATFTLRWSDPQPPALLATVQDAGPGIANLADVLGGQYRSTTGMGLGLIGSKRLCDEFDVQSAAGAGTRVTLAKRLPRGAPTVTPDVIARITAELARRTVHDPLTEVQQQNRELLRALEAVRQRQAEVEQLNAELAETNRGVVALYAELDEKADSLRRASEYKSRFLSDMTHEIRTPLNAITSLSRLLLDRVDGELTPEQEKQCSLIHRSATSLGEMVNDLLDLAKIEAGKTEVRLTEFAVSDVLSALRGMFRPLVTSPDLALVIEEPDPAIGLMRSDERKVAQILRNLVSNAIKFTERGEVRVQTTRGADDTVVLAVSDTGIGIAPEHLDAIFADYSQIDGPVQRRVRGTGLGLPLTRKLATLLGGDVDVGSAVGRGSRFVVTLPRMIEESDDHDGEADDRDPLDPARHGGDRE